MKGSINSLNLDLTIESGQVFLWHKEESWYGIYGDNVIKIGKEFASYPDHLSMEYIFRLDDDLSKILKSIRKDRVIIEAMRRYRGLRIIRQDPFQCLISFICATNTSIGMIRYMLTNLCRKFGSKVEWDSKEFYLFPRPSVLAQASVNDLFSCSLGFRARFVKDASIAVANGIDLEEIRKMNYNDAKSTLMQFDGIGNKVADCILLFSLDHLEAFPIDIWIARILHHYYKISIDPQKIGEKGYRMASEQMREYFGPYAGYAQQYLYCYARDKGYKNRRTYLAS